MSGPAGGVAGALWIARQAGYQNLLTLDMGGTSTDVALILDGVPRKRRETTVGDVTVRAPSLDVRSVGAGGGSIAHVPEITRALRVGPQSAGADPGPAAYGQGGDQPTVTDANVVLGYLPSELIGGEMKLDVDAAVTAVQTVATALGLDLKRAAAGIIDIVNENMFGALRLVSVQQGFDPRDFALIAFGGAGPLHANALARLMNSWPVMIPPSPACFAPTATPRRGSPTRLRGASCGASPKPRTPRCAASSTISRPAPGRNSMPRASRAKTSPCSTRWTSATTGQGLQLPVGFTAEEFERDGLDGMAQQFDDEHTQLFTFALDAEHEIVTLRAIVRGAETFIEAATVPQGGADPSAAKVANGTVYVDNRDQDAAIYDRAKLEAGNRIEGPAIVTEMDSTTLILPGHIGVVDGYGNIIINPIGH